MYKDKAKVPPFLLSLSIFRKSLHNYLIDLGSSCNIIPLLIAKTLGVIPKPSNQIVIQLDKTKVKVIEVLKDVRIQITIDPQIQDIIDMHVVEIPETYKLLLSRKWKKCLRGWF